MHYKIYTFVLLCRLSSDAGISAVHASGCEKFEEVASGKYCFGMCKHYALYMPL